MLGALLLLLGAVSAAAGVITVENRSARTIKAVAPGGSAVVEPGAAPVPIDFPNSDSVGVSLQVWWTALPRQLCRIFVPWTRTAVITGDQAITCLSHD
ncbi:MAG: hypothetical protein IPK78_14845 [Rhodospirillales bacterium]|nr:hypothetical protein [Rhodospirillales bacterium]